MAKWFAKRPKKSCCETEEKEPEAAPDPGAGPAPPPTRKYADAMAEAGGLAQFVEAKSDGVLVIDQDEDWDAVLEASAACGCGVVVEFRAKWCKQCKQIYPKFLDLSRRFAGSVVFVKIDSDDCDATAEKASVFRGIPLFQLYAKGQMVEEVLGAKEDKLVTMLEKFTEKND
jgi:thioredoxin 1